VVFGISPDSVQSHRKFRAKQELSYRLLADTEHAVAEAYGVWQEKKLFGISFDGNVRTTFLVAPDGRIAHVFEKVNPLGHGKQVADFIARMRTGR
jgi:peroxiredoxin Q/BCP